MALRCTKNISYAFGHDFIYISLLAGNSTVGVCYFGLLTNLLFEFISYVSEATNNGCSWAGTDESRDKVDQNDEQPWYIGLSIMVVKP
jgi:hypothetical protein